MPTRKIVLYPNGSGSDYNNGSTPYLYVYSVDAPVPYDAQNISASIQITKLKTYGSAFTLDLTRYEDVTYSYGQMPAGQIETNNTTHTSGVLPFSLFNANALAYLSLSAGTMPFRLKLTVDSSAYQLNLRDDSLITVTISYTLYTQCGAPTLTASASYADASAPVRLSWYGAVPGTNMSIAGYRIYKNGVAIGSTGNNYYDVAANGTMGAQDNYQVQTIASVAGYDSGLSNVATITTNTYTQCSAPTSVTLSKTFVAPCESITLSWSGAASGANNALAGYKVYRASLDVFTELLTTPGASATVYAPVNQGTQYVYKVMAIGTKPGYNSSLSAAYAVVKTGTAPLVPAGLTATPVLLESGAVTLTWSPSYDMDNDIHHYVLQAATSANGSAFGDYATILIPISTDISAQYTPNLPRGYSIKFRIQAVDTLGITSGWAYSAPIQRNQAPATPVVVTPTTQTYSTNPAFLVRITQDAEAQAFTVYASLDGGGYTAVRTITATGTYAIKCGTIPSGGHTVKFKVVDSLGASSDISTAFSFTVKSAAFARAITTGTVIANPSISHRADITEMVTMLNVQRAWVGLPSITPVGTLGKFADWSKQMQQLQQAVTQCNTISGASVLSWEWINNGCLPKASVINQLRSALSEI